MLRTNASVPWSPAALRPTIESAWAGLRSLLSIAAGLGAAVTTAGLLAYFFPAHRAAFLSVGVVIGLALASPFAERLSAAELSRLLLAAGLALVASQLVAQGVGVAWIGVLAAVGLAPAAEVAGARARFRRGLVTVAAVSVAWLIGSEISSALLTTSVMWDPAIRVAVDSGVLAGSLSLVFWASTRRRVVDEPPALESQDGAEFQHEPGDAERNAERTGRLEEEMARVRAAASRVEELVAQLVRLRPENASLVEPIRVSLSSTLEDAETAFARWSALDPVRARQLRIQFAREITETEALLEDEQAESVRAEVERTLQRQRRAVRRLEGVEAGRRAFDVRLRGVRAALSTLELSVQQALTEGRGVDGDEVDALVEAMNEAHVWLDDVDVEVDAATLASEPEPRTPLHLFDPGASHDRARCPAQAWVSSDARVTTAPELHA